MSLEQRVRYCVFATLDQAEKGENREAACSHSDAGPGFFRGTGGFAGHDARRQLRNDMNLGGIGKTERAQCAFESIDQLPTIRFSWTRIARKAWR